jgi:hypothetical protein
MLMYSTQGLAQKASSRSSGNDEVKQHVSEALARSKRITIRVKNPGYWSGTGMGREVTGLVKSVTGTCFQLEYKDMLNETKSVCVPYADATVVKWPARALHKLIMVGESTAIIVILGPPVIISRLLGVRWNC